MVKPLAIDLYAGLGGWAKERAAEYRSGVRDVKDLTRLFDSCFRIQREASAARGRHVPLIVENVRGAIPWVGRSRWNYGSYHFWGDVPALMPMVQKVNKVNGFRFDGSGRSFQTAPVEGVKVGGLDWSKHGEPGYAEGPGRCFRDSAIKNEDGSWFRVSHNKTAPTRGDQYGRPKHTPHMKNPAEHVKCGGDWFSGGANASLQRRENSRSPRRKMASAMIAKIPLPISRHIGRVFYAG